MSGQMSRDPLTDAYLAYARAAIAGPTSDEQFEVWEAIHALLPDHPERLWTILCESLAEAEGDRMLASIAAGPLEDLITGHGPQFIDRLEALARRDAKFRRALVGVWGRSSMNRDVAARLDRLIANEQPL